MNQHPQMGRKAKRTVGKAAFKTFLGGQFHAHIKSIAELGRGWFLLVAWFPIHVEIDEYKREGSGGDLQFKAK